MTSPRYTFLRPLLNTNQNWAGLELVTPDESPFSLGPDTSLAGLLADSPLCATPILLRSLTGAWPGGDLTGLAQTIPLADATTIGHLSHGNEGRRQRFGVMARAGDDVDTLAAAGIACYAIGAAEAQARISPLALQALLDEGILLAAVQVTSHDLFVWCAARGFQLIGAEFVTRPDDLPSGQADPSKLKLLHLLSLVVQDAATREIEEVFRGEPKLSYNLLRLVNSASGSGHAKITSFSQAILLLGRRQLQRWLQLLIYAHQYGDGTPNPLLQQAAWRGKFIEHAILELRALQSPAAHPEEAQEVRDDRAFMTGMFSLLDVLLNLPQREILASLPLHEEVAAALSARRGLLGALLTIAEQIEQGLFARAETLLADLALPAEAVLRVEAHALAWASTLHGQDLG